jgi:hypothetical protein
VSQGNARWANTISAWIMSKALPTVIEVDVLDLDTRNGSGPRIERANAEAAWTPVRYPGGLRPRPRPR